MNHTPGPWIADIRTGCLAVYPESEAKENRCLSGADITAIHYQDGRGEVFSGSSYKSITDEQEYNARLISAAPELLEACESFVKAISGEMYFHSDIKVKAVAAIKKAKG